MSERGSGLERRVDYGVLTSFYGSLLTARQQAMLGLYCDEDLGLAEIAKHLGVPRQCVNDTLNRAFERLDQLEEGLGLVRRFASQQEAITTCRCLIEQAMAGENVSDNLSRASRLLNDYLQEEETEAWPLKA